MIDPELMSLAEEIAQLARPYSLGYHTRPIVSCAVAIRREALMLQLEDTYDNGTGVGATRLLDELMESVETLVKVAGNSPEGNLFRNVLLNLRNVSERLNEEPF